MTVQYYESEIDEIEQEKRLTFTGYINPRGQLIDYTTLIGERTHYSTKNPASMLFLQFISYVVKGFDLEELRCCWDEDESIYKRNITDGFTDVVKRGFSYFDAYNQCDYDSFLEQINVWYEKRKNYIKKYMDSSEPLWDMPVYETLQNDIMHFYKKAYQGKDFFKALGIIPSVDGCKCYLKDHKEEIKHPFLFDYLDCENRRCFNDYQTAQLMSYFKDIMVMYMGYDSVERRLKLDPKKSAKFKVITTSCTNPNERFYNWLLMDWNVQRIPRMYWNEQEERFIKEDPTINYYQTDKEKILGQEIASIKKEVPKQYRKEYFRN